MLNVVMLSVVAPFQPNLIFASKVRILPARGAPQIFCTLVGSCLTQNIRLDRKALPRIDLHNSKHSSLFCWNAEDKYV